MSDTEREKPQARVYRGTSESTTIVECPFVHHDGWNEVTVGWSEEDGAWIANVSTQSGACGISEASQLHALAELVRSLGALCSIYERREVELHRAIHNAPDSLAKELCDAERDLHKVQGYITTHVEPGEDNWDEGLKPLWRAERAIEAFAARIATPAQSDAA